MNRGVCGFLFGRFVDPFDDFALACDQDAIRLRTISVKVSQ